MRVRRETGSGAAAKIVGGVALLGVTYLVVRSVPELLRYLRVRRM